jgi:hypothetical protein
MLADEYGLLLADEYGLMMADEYGLCWLNCMYGSKNSHPGCSSNILQNLKFSDIKIILDRYK